MRYWQPTVSHRAHLLALSPPARLVRFARAVVGGRGGRSPWFGPARYALERPEGVREDAYTDDERSSALLHFFRRLTARGSWSPFIDDGDDKSGSNATGADYIGSASEELPPLRERAILVLDRDQKKRSIENVAELVSALRAAFEPLGVAVHRRTPTTIPDEHSPRGFTAGPRAMARLLAHNTSALISTHGSQLVNAGFLPPGAIVAEVCKKVRLRGGSCTKINSISHVRNPLFAVKLRPKDCEAKGRTGHAMRTICDHVGVHHIKVSS